MTRLSDIQLVLLAAAAQRPDGSVLPPPDSVSGQAARLTRTIKALLTRTLVSEAEVTDAACAWRQEGERAIGVFITDAGRSAIGVPPAAIDEVGATPEIVAPPATAEPGKPGTKLTQVLELLRREEGATLAELTSITGWLPHTTRAALTRLRQKGHVLDKGKRGDITRYAIVEAA